MCVVSVETDSIKLVHFKFVCVHDHFVHAVHTAIARVHMSTVVEWVLLNATIGCSI